MKIGAGLFTSQRRPDDDRPMAALYDELLELGKAIESAGLDSAWVSEHHFQPDGYCSAPLPVLGALAAVTDEIEIGSCVALAPLYDPVRLAEDAIGVELLSDGRLTLGLAIGSNPDEFEAFGVDPDERAERLTDAIGVLEGAFTPGALAYDSDFHPISPERTITPTPESVIPIVLGGSAKPAVRRAARRAAGWCSPSALSVEAIETRVADIRRVRATEGLDGPFSIYVLVHGFVCSPDAPDERAWEQLKTGYLYTQRRYAEIFSGENVPALSQERRETLKERAIYGTPTTVADELERYERALGADIHVIFRTYQPGIDTAALRASIRRLGRDVRPLLD
ncbi:LLM class flavin-dependent oxidoreductase [Halocatena halophila]|uniref:LLM class flavin-dependent oxidoreductase n=1 Tax=Halocatena halophila TaxID=2814576 RepID=UPI002ED4DE6C